MEARRKNETIFIGSLIIATILLGIWSCAQEMNIVVTAVCFSVGITSLVYWFLGGISSATFNVGYLQMGGSIAALFGGVYLIYTLMQDGSLKCNRFEVVTTPKWALNMETGTPAEIVIKHADNPKDSLISKFSKHKFKFNHLQILNNEMVSTDNGFVLGSLDKNAFFEKGFFKSIKNSNDPGELLSLSKGQSVKIKRLECLVKAVAFKKNNIAEFEIKSTVQPENSTTFLIRNKGMQVVLLNGWYYLVSFTQAQFSKEITSENYAQLFIKPLIVE